MTDDEQPTVDGIGIEQPVEVTAAIKAVARARVAESLLVVAVCIAALALIGTTAWNTYRLQHFSRQQVEAQNFGLKAVSCILENFAEHRWSNQVFHDQLGTFLHAPLTPHTPLPNLPTDAQFAEDCGPFNKGKIVVSSTTTPTTVTTAHGGGG
jgi:hypothetical protein